MIKLLGISSYISCVCYLSEGSDNRFTRIHRKEMVYNKWRCLLSKVSIGVSPAVENYRLTSVVRGDFRARVEGDPRIARIGVRTAVFAFFGVPDRLERLVGVRLSVLRVLFL